MSAVHPVATRRAAFCVIWSLFVEVGAAMVDHMVLAYSSVGLVIAL